VLAALQQNGFALEDALEELRSNEAVVLAAVQQAGQALRYASEELRSNEAVVLAAVQQDGQALYHASEELQTQHVSAAQECGVDLEEYTQAVLNPLVVQVTSSAEPFLMVSNLAGDVLASISMEPDESAAVLSKRIGSELSVLPVSLEIIFPAGQRWRPHDVGSSIRGLQVRQLL